MFSVTACQSHILTDSFYQQECENVPDYQYHNKKYTPYDMKKFNLPLSISYLTLPVEESGFSRFNWDSTKKALYFLRSLPNGGQAIKFPKLWTHLRWNYRSLGLRRISKSRFCSFSAIMLLWSPLSNFLHITLQPQAKHFLKICVLNMTEM